MSDEVVVQDSRVNIELHLVDGHGRDLHSRGLISAEREQNASVWRLAPTSQSMTRLNALATEESVLLSVRQMVSSVSSVTSTTGSRGADIGSWSRRPSGSRKKRGEVNGRHLEAAPLTFTD